jgi:hypothetical protein
MEKRAIKAWAIGMDGDRLMKYVFSYDGEHTLMVFPTRKDAQVFRGNQKRMDIFKVLILLPSKPCRKAKRK